MISVPDSVRRPGSTLPSAVFHTITPTSRLKTVALLRQNRTGKRVINAADLHRLWRARDVLWHSAGTCGELDAVFLMRARLNAAITSRSRSIGSFWTVLWCITCTKFQPIGCRSRERKCIILNIFRFKMRRDDGKEKRPKRLAIQLI